MYTISCMYFSVYLVWQHHAKPLTQPFQLVLQTQILKTFYLYHSFHDMCSWSCSFLLSDSMSNFFPLIHLTSLFKFSSFSDNSFLFLSKFIHSLSLSPLSHSLSTDLSSWSFSILLDLSSLSTSASFSLKAVFIFSTVFCHFFFSSHLTSSSDYQIMVKQKS